MGPYSAKLFVAAVMLALLALAGAALLSAHKTLHATFSSGPSAASAISAPRGPTPKREAPAPEVPMRRDSPTAGNSSAN